MENLEIKINRKFWKGKKVLVTGHEGFLGSWLTRALVESGARVKGIDIKIRRDNPVLKNIRHDFQSCRIDIADRRCITDIISRFRPEIIFHLAAEAIVSEAYRDPVRAFQSNIEGTWNILEAVRDQKFIKAVVAASSDKAYGSHKKLPYYESFPLQGEHPYDVSKSCSDLICRTYYHTYNVPVCVTRCGNIYGPGDAHLSRIVPDGVRSAVQGKQLVIRSDGKFTRDYIFIADIVSAYLAIAEQFRSKKLAGEAFNFSNEQPLSVLALFNEILQLSENKNQKPKILNQAKFEIRHQYLSASKARRVLGWRPRYNLREGLNETLRWYKKHGTT